jgi:transposase
MAPSGVRFERREGCPCRVKGARPGLTLLEATQAGDRCNKVPSCSRSTAFVVGADFQLKRFRRVATRYDKTAASFPAFATLAACTVLWK